MKNFLDIDLQTVVNLTVGAVSGVLAYYSMDFFDDSVYFLGLPGLIFGVFVVALQLLDIDKIAYWKLPIWILASWLSFFIATWLTLNTETYLSIMFASLLGSAILLCVARVLIGHTVNKYVFFYVDHMRIDPCTCILPDFWRLPWKLHIGNHGSLAIFHVGHVGQNDALRQ